MLAGMLSSRAVIDARPPAWSNGSSRSRDVRDERVLTRDGACAARALRAGRAPRSRVRRRRPPDRQRADDLSARAMVALICELLALSGDERVLDVGTGSGYPGRCSRSSPGEVHALERPAGARRTRARSARGRRLCGTRSVVHVGDGTLGDPEPRALRRDRRRGRRARRCRSSPVRTARARTGGSFFPSAADTTSCSSASSGRPYRPKVDPLLPCSATSSRFVGREGFSGR